MVLTGRILVILSISLIFLAYSNFLPSALRTDAIADYVKNHFIREVIFGLALAVCTIILTLGTMTFDQWIMIAILGSIVVLPFWIATALGWSTGGMEKVWGDQINASGAYMLHGPQVALFYLGITILYFNLQD
ncbi:hypothetical protein NBRC116588_02490 [Pyruvatibacter sp. HU-CL02332]|uniref:hypothetical protein n=1 Tax=Pyruvatibacter sp. HU-CL02332 TaxID=3127650 RepID=UPI00310589E7